MTATRTACSLSLDLDNLWSYLKTHGDAGWETHPSYLDRVVPRVLEWLARHELRITFFIVGQDAALDRNRDALAAITRAGHDVGNHSFRHEPWLHRYSAWELGDELTRAEDAIERALGVRPRGFRGPGYSLSAATLDLLAERGYRYDASTLPTFIGPLARAYYFMRSGFDTDERRRRDQLFGNVRDALQPVRPYRWCTTEGDLLEIPVTTFPGLRIPIHFSYLLYLSTYAAPLADAYFQSALGACRVRGVEPSLLLHPLDFLGPEDTQRLAFFPGMSLSADTKLNLLDRWVNALRAHFDVIGMDEHAERLLKQPDLQRRSAHELGSR